MPAIGAVTNTFRALGALLQAVHPPVSGNFTGSVLSAGVPACTCFVVVPGPH